MNNQYTNQSILARNKKNALDFYFLALHELKFEEGIEKYTGKVYRQHNPNVPDDKDGFISHFKETKAKYPDGGSTVLRTVADGNYVGVQVNHLLTPEPNYLGLASIDIFMLDDNGKLVEHWDAMQCIPSQTASGHTMFDGPTKIQDLDKTDANKRLVESFVDKVIVGHNLDKFTDYFDGEHCIQHSPPIADGVSAWLNDIEETNGKTKPLKYRKLHRVLGEGNFVLTQSEVDLDGLKTVKMDLFRVENGKIAEHWDAIWEELPEKMAHDNGLF